MARYWRSWLLSFVVVVGSAIRFAPHEPDVAANDKLPPAAARKIDFVKEVQPIFVAKCYSCHGPQKQESAYRLDHQPTALKGGDIGPAVIPGKSAESPLIRYVAGVDPDIKMPPEGERLTAEQVAILRAWIDQGAEWPESASVDLKSKGADHWAFKAPVRPVVPSIQNPKSKIQNPIDNFIIGRLQREGLNLSPETDRITWLRRLSLDLIGLPPTVDEVDAFVADQSPDAFDKQVDRLLASPHYGERWSRHWLDAARYADSDGFEKDKSRQVWFYRDWVVNAFNRDLPYDQFLIEQLAGDLLPNATQDQRVATGFLRHSMLNEEGGVDPEQFRMDAMFDRMDAIGKAMLGLTIQCAQCHDHKFDPFTHDDYYRLFAFLNNDHEAQPVVYTPAEQMQIAELRRQMSEIEEELRRATLDWQQRLAEWEVSGTALAAGVPRLQRPAASAVPLKDSTGGVASPVHQSQSAWTTLQLTHIGDNGQRYFDQGDGSLVAAGYAPTKFTAHFASQPLSQKNLTAIRLELLNDPNLPCGGPGRSFKGTCALTEITVEAENAAKPGEKQAVKLVKATADYGNPERELEANFFDKTDKRRVTGPVEFAIDGKDETAWGIDAGPGRRNQPRNAVFVFDKPVSFEDRTILHVHLKQNHGGWNSDDHMNHNLGRFRLSATSAPTPSADPVPAAVRAVLSIPSDRRSPAQQAEVFAYWRTTLAEFAPFNNRMEALWQQWPVGSTQLVLTPRETPRDTRILARGDFLKPTKPVTPGFPEFLNDSASRAASAPGRSATTDNVRGLTPSGSPEQGTQNRLTFARWLANRNSPTTARVIVNRVWQAYFGTGLVSTPEDFGLQSDPPSHPELLDWLAVEFMEHGWSLKHLHRLITLSATYRQSSHVTPDLFERDQFNRLLARFPRQRVEGEIVRDIALAASGLLNERLGGPAIFSPSPAFLYQPPASYGPFTWTEETGPDRYRRGLYTFRRRSTPYPMLTNFDTPNADFSCVKRTRSNTPLQALTTLNEVVFLECARSLSMLTLTEGGSDDSARLTFAFRRCVSRSPTDTEREVLLKLLSQQRAKFSVADAKPWELAADAPANPPLLPNGVTPADAAAWTVLARVLLNLDETVTRE
ncbi:MAG TPA: PSD1 and planctomycete cytochrome C domain-containing protein [Planctomycetaceae bacterium]|nr:PSD1 and planctomycete cytochrome C domain-containing protein [Planctomycetaceae bacterium]